MFAKPGSTSTFSPPARRSASPTLPPQGHRQLKRRLRVYRVKCIAIEATGKWHRQVHRSLHAAGYAVAVVNPLRVRLFAEAIGVLAKTDRLDARILALFADQLAPATKEPAAKEIEALQELVQARDSAVAEAIALGNQRRAATTAFLRKQIERRCKRLQADIDALAAEIARRIEADDTLACRYAILISIPGVGPLVAASLLARLPELGRLDAKEITLLAGLAPIADDSGNRSGHRHIKGGRPAPRRSLYLAALVASRANPAMKAFYQRLCAAGMEAKPALIAVARKLVILANTLLKENRPWLPLAPNHA
jgi:transposase